MNCELSRTSEASLWRVLNNLRKILLPDKNIEVLVGPYDENIKFLESLFNVTINLRGSNLLIEGNETDVNAVERILKDFTYLVDKGHSFSNGDLKAAFKQIAEDAALSLQDFFPKLLILQNGKKPVMPKSVNQRRYVEAIRQYDIVFGVGPGGTGKTFLAVAMALSYLYNKVVSRIVLTRPAVEAGERLGFLPGDIEEKINPYLRPLYDALQHLAEPEKIRKYMESGIIEIAPLAFMRGRTLSDAFIILDEAQNTTSEQMKMFLTRIGFNSKAVITGDVTQIDLPAARTSGLVESLRVLAGIEGIGFCFFDEKDVVRHRLVRLIIRAYENHSEASRTLLGMRASEPAAQSKPSGEPDESRGGINPAVGETLDRQC
ncbi:MAG: PhoH family protein [Acidobacteria bacterium]|nr:PhoH family protein [Acidobacteriota bacterium]MBI3657121.1 PhoH family protein [Acidobacteriota bacterium]